MNILTKILRVLWIWEYRSAFLRTRVVASTEHDCVLDGLELDTIVDVGANRGQFALCARRLFPEAQIFSFEPLEKPSGTYRKVFDRDPRTRLFTKAIAATEGSAAMHVTRWDVSSSLLPIAKGQQENFPFSDEARRETVSVAKLADEITPGTLQGNCMLKIDVQGSELSTLEACSDLLGAFRYVYVEASFVELYVGQALASDVIAHLLNRGFSLICVANLSYGQSRRPIQADFLFARTSIAAK